MDIVNELFGDLGGWLIIIISLFMFVAIPLGIRWLLGHTKVSPAEEMDRRAHPENFRK